MLEYLFPVSFKAHTPVRLALLLAAYLLLPIFIGIVGSLAAAIPYISILMTLLTAIVSTYCVGGAVVALLFFLGKIR